MQPTLYISIDGVRPDALAQCNTPTLDSFMREGAYTLKAQSAMPTITLPCHTATFFSVPASRHGVISNDWAPMARPIPSIIDVAFENGRKTAAFHSWGMFRNLSHPDTLTFLSVRHYEKYGLEIDRMVTNDVIHFFKREQADFTFIYLLLPDSVGHAYGWMSEPYLKEVEKVDGLIGEIMKVLPEEMTVLIHADHGGHERTHGTNSSEDMTIPWLIKGPTVKKGHEVKTAVSILDTAPTIAHLLNIPPAPQWEGKPVLEAFID